MSCQLEKANIAIPINQPIEEKEIKEFPQLSFNDIMPILEHIPSEDDPILQELWSSLLANTLCSKTRKLFYKLLKEFDSEDAVTFKQIFQNIQHKRKIWKDEEEQRYDEYKNKWHGLLHKSPEEARNDFVKQDRMPEKYLHLSIDDYDLISIENLMRLGLLENPEMSYTKEVKVEDQGHWRGDTDFIEISLIDKTAIITSSLGAELYRIITSA